VNDLFAGNGTVGANGRMFHDMYLMEVKTPEESTQPWDYYKVLSTIPGDQAFIDPADSGCPLVEG
jgi:branched-chain amino acid transport system substrate-binding protein